MNHAHFGKNILGAVAPHTRGGSPIIANAEWLSAKAALQQVEEVVGARRPESVFALGEPVRTATA